jgi:exonuclease V gamma subunit
MRTTESEPTVRYLDPRTATLLEELGEECQTLLKLLAQLERPGLQEEQIDSLLGELSAAILHLHEHTRGLDELLDEEGKGEVSL